ncbi:hypothetical protein [Methanoplanus endosymbiosus]|uniref:Uncharacterized protein n=1 Tax=Methanoplanus endosymbiosus TaxID=33865 RepID=A0A9E7PPK2_9EURY|nr:hypothetical protein [Methanoplanus endosymbiosus]UUX93122.1 hypothetical protein L6E24_03085 [Methanoplanus endosymbiosus]
MTKTKNRTKTIAAILLLIFLAAGSASAYIINFDMPATVQSGETLIISGTGTLPAGFSTGMEFYTKIQTGNKKVATVPFTIQNDGLWSAEVDTTGWLPGIYTVTILKNSEYSYGSSSTLQKSFTVTKSTTANTESKTATAPTDITSVTESTTTARTETGAVTESTAAPENIPAASTAEAGAATPKGTPLPLWIPALALCTAVFRIKTKNE